MQGIYRILNLSNGKWYVGSAGNIKVRWADHKKALRNGCDSRYLQNAFNKYGAENFVLEILEEVKGKRGDAYDREQEYLNRWFSTRQLYNASPLAIGGIGPPLGHKVTQETRDKLSKAQLKYYKAHEVTQETRAKLSAASIGHEVSQETRHRISKANSGKNNGMYGKRFTHTREAKNKIAKPYPAFYNVKTKQVIPAGRNLWRMCQEYNLNYYNIWDLKRGRTNQSQDGWRIAN